MKAVITQTRSVPSRHHLNHCGFFSFSLIIRDSASYGAMPSLASMYMTMPKHTASIAARRLNIRKYKAPSPRRAVRTKREKSDKYPIQLMLMRVPKPIFVRSTKNIHTRIIPLKINCHVPYMTPTVWLTPRFMPE